MRESFSDLFAHPRFADYQRALTDRHAQKIREMENWQPISGADAGTNLASIVADLREMATLRWLHDEVPALLTESEKRVQEEIEAEFGGESYDAEAEGGALAGEDRYAEGQE